MLAMKTIETFVFLPVVQLDVMLVQVQCVVADSNIYCREILFLIQQVEHLCTLFELVSMLGNLFALRYRIDKHELVKRMFNEHRSMTNDRIINHCHRWKRKQQQQHRMHSKHVHTIYMKSIMMKDLLFVSLID
jgi:hypothetical protein